MLRKIACIVGTRPEVIKMAPLILQLRTQSWAEVCVIATAQHRDMLDQAMHFWGITANHDLNIMQPDQTLAMLTTRLLNQLDNTFHQEQPDVVLAQGDTTTTMAAALACLYRKIPFGHVEAGLRTHDLHNPFPEEANRALTARLAKWHFAPTESARNNLLEERIAGDAIHLTGNTVIDALFMAVAKKPSLPFSIDKKRRLVLITLHRRENFGTPLAQICEALRTLAIRNLDVQFVYPVHPNPHVQSIVHKSLDNIDNLLLCNPLDYPEFVAALDRCYLVISDSGGVQEEAPALGKPILVTRSTTERPEAAAAGVAQLLGTATDVIVTTTQRLLDDASAYQAMARGISPYGDGQAAARIIKILQQKQPSD